MVQLEDDYLKMELKIKGKNAVKQTGLIMKAIEEAEKEMKKADERERSKW